MKKGTTGERGEAIAAEYLTLRGYRIITRNFFARTGEIDIIAQDGQYILFVEVKTRAAKSLVSAAESVTPVKRRRLVQTASRYLQEHPVPLQPRFDVICVENNGGILRVTEHIENAFDGCVL